MNGSLFALVAAAGLSAAVFSTTPDGTVAGFASHDTTRIRAIHLLNRITYGPRPGDVERVMAMGIESFLAQQLHPETIDESALDARLGAFHVHRTSSSELLALDRAARQERNQRQARGDTTNPRMSMTPDRDVPEIRRLLGEFQQIPIVRAIEADRQLYEIMVDFWSNHFNIYLGKARVRPLAPAHIEHVIRPHAMGTFQELLMATAQSPAMLAYLDNANSVAPESTNPQVTRAQRAVSRQARNRRVRAGQGNVNGATPEERLAVLEARMPTGINENYARELLELHTLGVDGGYTQHDVEETARILTGWSFNNRGLFVFNAWAHDSGDKVVLGQSYPASGMNEGITLLNWLATQPATQHHVSAKLCAKFVSDQMSDACVDDAVVAWRRSNGNIREILHAILTSDSFWDDAQTGSKTKTPLEYIVSGIRALDGHADSTLALTQILRRLGQPMYGFETPTGYPETQEAWVNAGALLDRLNVALMLTGRNPRGVEQQRLGSDPFDAETIVHDANQQVLNGLGSEQTLSVVLAEVRQARTPAQARAIALGYMIGSPEFQRQ